MTALLPRGIVRHAANSAAIHRYAATHLDMVRMGISMYGYAPVPESLPLLPVMRWYTEITM